MITDNIILITSGFSNILDTTIFGIVSVGDIILFIVMLLLAFVVFRILLR